MSKGTSAWSVSGYFASGEADCPICGAKGFIQGGRGFYVFTCPACSREHPLRSQCLPSGVHAGLHAEVPGEDGQVRKRRLKAARQARWRAKGRAPQLKEVGPLERD
jgi:hypothetical protein